MGMDRHAAKHHPRLPYAVTQPATHTQQRGRAAMSAGRMPAEPSGVRPRRRCVGKRAAALHPGTWTQGALATTVGDPPRPREARETGNSRYEIGEGMTQMIAATTEPRRGESAHHP